MPTLITWQDATGALGVVRLDAVQTENPEDVLSITDHPVEQGANVVDHAREEPTRITIEGLVSSIPSARVDTDAGFQSFEFTAPAMTAPGTQTIKIEPPKTPLDVSPNGLIQAGIGALTNAVTGGPNLNGTFAGVPQRTTATLKGQFYQQNAPRDRIRDVYEALRRVQTARQLVTVSTSSRDYFDMMIERLAKPRAVEEGTTAKFQIDLKQIRVAQSKTVAAPKPTEERGKGPVNKGAQAGKKDEDPKQRRKTLAKAVLDSLSGG